MQNLMKCCVFHLQRQRCYRYLLGMGLAFVLFMPGVSAAKVDWQVMKTMNLVAVPLDIAQSADGRYTFVLTADAKVVIFAWDGRVVDTIAVDPGVDRIDITGGGEILYLSNKVNKSVQEIRIGYVFEFDFRNSPIIGNIDAPVTIAAFFDYQ